MNITCDYCPFQKACDFLMIDCNAKTEKDRSGGLRMSLLIKGMDIPKGSSNFVKTAYTCDLVISKDGKHELVNCGARYSCYEISTPHGRLIDENDVIREIQRFKGYLDEDMIWRIEFAIKNRTETIIEAEDEP